MMDTEVLVKELIAELCGIPEAELLLETKLEEDLNLDSLDLVELAMELEDAFGFMISDEEALGLKTVGDVIEFSKAKATP